MESISKKRDREVNQDNIVEIDEKNDPKSKSGKKKIQTKSNVPLIATKNKNKNVGVPEGLSILASTAVDIETRQREDRLGYLTTHMHTQLMNSFNTRDMNSLKLIIEDTFLPDCQLRTSAVPNGVMGRDKIYQFFETYIQGCPDVSLQYITPMQFNTRVISFICAEQGTRSNFNVHDQLFDHLRHGVERTPQFLCEKSKYSFYRNAKMSIPFITTSYVNFILNEAMTHVEKYVHTCKDIKVADPMM